MTDQPGRAEIYMAAARAYCVAKFNYGDGYVDGEAGRQRHIENDAAGVAEEPWVRAMVDAALDARSTDTAGHRSNDCPVCGTGAIMGTVVRSSGRSEFVYSCSNGHGLTINPADPGHWEAVPGVSYSARRHFG